MGSSELLSKSQLTDGLKVWIVLAEAQVWFPAPTLCGSELIVIPTLGDPRSPDAFSLHGLLYPCAHTHTKTHIYIHYLKHKPFKNHCWHFCQKIRRVTLLCSIVSYRRTGLEGTNQDIRADSTGQRKCLFRLTHMASGAFWLLAR